MCHPNNSTCSMFSTKYYDCKLCEPTQSNPIFNFQFNSYACVVCVSVFIGFFNSIYYYFTRKLLILHNSDWSTEPIAHWLLKHSFRLFCWFYSSFFFFSRSRYYNWRGKRPCGIVSYRKYFISSFFFSFQLEYCVIRWVNGATGYVISLLFSLEVPFAFRSLFESNEIISETKNRPFFSLYVVDSIKSKTCIETTYIHKTKLNFRLRTKPNKTVEKIVKLLNFVWK